MTAPDPSSTAPIAHALYTARREESRARIDTRKRQENRLSNARLLAFLALVGVGWMAFGVRSWPPLSLLPPALLFVGLLVVHDRTIRAREAAERRADFYEGGLARLEDRWAGLGNQGVAFRDDKHPYAWDLDLYGEGSLFELLCTARTGAGQSTLAQWLGEAGSNEAARARQGAVEEWRDRVDFREALASLGEDLKSHVDPQVLVQWGAEAEPEPPPALRALPMALAIANVATLLAALLSNAGWVPFGLSVVLSGVVARALRSRVAPLLHSASRPTRDLSLVGLVLARIEEEPGDCEALRGLRASLDADGLPPSQQIARLRRLVDLLDARGNQFFAPIGALLLWGTQVGFALQRWRAHCGPQLGRWIEALGELEALAALSGYAYEHPDDPFPELLDEGPCIEGEALGHPLLPRDRCITNDLRLDATRQAFIVSGSNMSGKSTWLRTIGTNAVLAYAGAPVRAQRLRLSPLAVSASIRVIDSLQEGTSHFYAEILRLRQVVERASGDRPALFLLDEILHGTNSHDRRIGAEAVLKGLLERGAVGLITTHDLALAKMVEALAPRVENVHFRDHLEGGEMRFDYQLHDGVVTRSNALELMRAVGLEV